MEGRANRNNVPVQPKKNFQFKIPLNLALKLIDNSIIITKFHKKILAHATSWPRTWVSRRPRVFGDMIVWYLGLRHILNRDVLSSQCYGTFYFEPVKLDFYRQCLQKVACLLSWNIVASLELFFRRRCWLWQTALVQPKHSAFTTKNEKKPNLSGKVLSQVRYGMAFS